MKASITGKAMLTESKLKSAKLEAKLDKAIHSLE